MENLYDPNCIRTSSGIYVNVFEPNPEMFEIEDIAHSLSQQCRFGGHTQNFYSVAQHCCLCYELSLPEYEFDCLMHDSSEAYLLDVPRPIKRQLINYKTIEHDLMLVLAQKFGFRFPLDSYIKRIDEIALKIEWEVVMLQTKLLEDRTIFNIKTPKEAELLFLKYFREGNESRTR